MSFVKINKKMKEIIKLMEDDSLKMIGGTYENGWKYKIQLLKKKPKTNTVEGKLK